MTRKTLICEVSGVVDAPLDQVADILLDVRRSGLVPGGADPGRPAYPSVEVDRPGNAMAVQGGWWYRGEYSLEPAPTGTRVVHRVYNVAQWMRWGVPLANRFFLGFESATRDGFDAGLRKIAVELGCTARLE
jgi:hypothetical protein